HPAGPAAERILAGVGAARPAGPGLRGPDPPRGRSRRAAGGLHGAHHGPATRHSRRDRVRHESHRRRVPRFEPRPAQDRERDRRRHRRLPARARAQTRDRRAHEGPVTPPPIRLFGTSFQNPVLLASGTAGFGREVSGVIDLDALGGIVTKAVTPEPRRGARAPRVAEFAGGMLNAVGLANPGLDAVREHELPWLAGEARRARVLVNVAGATLEDYARVIAGLTDLAVITAFEINASCPNTSAGGLEFGATPEGLRELVRRCRAAGAKPMSVKLSPVLPDIVAMARVARDEGADAVTLVNTIPGRLDHRLANGSGGVSGRAACASSSISSGTTSRAWSRAP